MATETLAGDAEILRRIDLDLIQDEIIIFLRNNLTDRRSRATSATDNFTGDGSTTLFTFTEGLDSQSRSKIMNVKTVTVSGTSKAYFTDYVVGYSKESAIEGKIQFWNPPADSAAIITTIEHTYSWIYTERPRINLTSRSYPRVSVNIKGKPELAACGGKATKYVIEVTLTIIDEKKDFVENIINEIQTLFTERTNQVGFHNFGWIYITNVGDVLPSSEDDNDTVYGVEISLEIPHEYQFSK